MADLNMDDRTRIGTLGYWHACVILLLRELESRKRTDEEVQDSAQRILDLCDAAGEKIEFMMWVSIDFFNFPRFNLILWVCRG